MNTSKIVLRLMLVLVAFLLPAAVFAQTSNGTIAGTVTDQSGAVVPKATVKAESTLLNVPVKRPLTPAVRIDIESLSPGTYSITFTSAGFDIYQVNDVSSPLPHHHHERQAKRQHRKAHGGGRGQAGEQIDTQSGQMGTNLTLHGSSRICRKIL